MNIQTHFLNASGKLTPYLDTIKEEINIISEKVNKIMPLNDVDVVAYNNPSDVVLEMGVGGFAPSSNLIYLSLDVDKFPIDKTVLNNLGKTLIHEFHHTRRWEDPGYGETLLEAMVTEGLADHFEEEITKDKPLLWATSLNSKELHEVETLARKEFGDKNYNHNEWFFGSQKRGIPRWSGYALGYKIICDYLALHPDKKASTLYATSAPLFVSPRT